MKEPIFIILSLKHSSNIEPVFWRADDSGYTTLPWAAGLYSESQVRGNPGYYNDGYNTIAIPLTDEGIKKSGLRFSLKAAQLNAYIKANKHNP